MALLPLIVNISSYTQFFVFVSLFVYLHIYLFIFVVKLAFQGELVYCVAKTVLLLLSRESPPVPLQEGTYGLGCLWCASKYLI